jgi:signal transduction histidine kinase
MLSETEYLSPIILFEKGKVASQIVYSNLEQIVEQQQYFFDNIWSKAMPAKDRIYDLEHGVEKSPFIETIRDPVEVQMIGFNCIQSATEEILIIFSTANAFYRQIIVAGVMQLCKEAASERNIKIRILTPKDDRIDKIVQEILQEQRSQEQQQRRGINIRYIEPALQTKTTALIVDKKFSLSVEVKDDTKNNSIEAIGLATYSNSAPTVLSYASIFESLWNQTELYEQLKEAHEQVKLHDKMQKEFINIAAHELRTPIQPVIGLSQVLQSKMKNDNYTEYQELLDAIVRNAKRLQQLTENILDVTKIESNSLQLSKERFSLCEMVLNTMTDYKSQLKGYDNIKVELACKEEDVSVQADKARIGQVIYNLLNNAMMFTQEGSISINVVKKGNEDRKGNRQQEEVIVSIKDTGVGIAPEIMPRLFTKFATKSEKGTGLGLYISKSIIEAHGGKIWAENNPNGEGATFSFSLPTIKQ